MSTINGLAITEDAIRRAASDMTSDDHPNGLVCLFPLDNELCLDLDGPSCKVNFKVLDALRKNNILVIGQRTTKSKSGNRHVYYRFNTTFDVTSRLTLQAALGSDPIREALSALRYKNGCPGNVCSAIFELDDQAAAVVSWREAYERALKTVEEIPF